MSELALQEISAPFAGCGVLELTLPWPPSVNTYWRSRIAYTRDGKPYSHYYISEKGREFREFVGKLCLDFSVKQWAREHHGKPIGAQVYAFPPDAGKHDLDNIEKALWDSLKEAQVLRDDNDIWDKHSRRCCIRRPPGSVIVRLMAFDLTRLAAPTLAPSNEPAAAAG